MKLKKIQNHKSTESEKEEEEEEETPTGFAFTVTKVAVSQICSSSSRYVGFKAAESSALETLTLVATKYLQELATTAASYSHAANRTESNLLDLTNALNDMSFGVGFPGASTLNNNCLLSSGALKEIASFVKHSSEIPFAKPIRRNRRNVNTNSLCCKKGIDWGSRSLHIPKWLPAFPDEETCKERQGPVRNISETLWENSEIIVKAADSCNFGGDEEGDVLRGGNLAKERDKVRFKIGVKGNNGVGLEVGLRNGVCRGGKRVSWNVGDIVEDDQNRGFKYKRSF